MAENTGTGDIGIGKPRSGSSVSVSLPAGVVSLSVVVVGISGKSV